jgi:hypothetical protein
MLENGLKFVGKRLEIGVSATNYPNLMKNQNLNNSGNSWQKNFGLGKA